MQKRKIVLASRSPRRKRLMEQIGLEFEIRESQYEEDMGAKKNPYALAKFLALKKAEDVAKHYQDAVIIAADTFVILKDKFIGKPKSIAEAKKMLKLFSGQKHKMVTGYAIIDTKKNKLVSDYTFCELKFKKLDNKEIDKYVKIGQPLDKAGAYAIQDLGGIFVENVSGNYFAIVGLPINRIYLELKKMGVDVLNL